MEYLRKQYQDLLVTDYLIGYVVESKDKLPAEKAWEALEALYPNVYDMEDLVQLSERAWAVYD